MLKVQRNPGYIQNLKELIEEQSELTEEIDTRVEWFKKNPNDTRLDNHELIKMMAGRWAFSITGDIRVVYEWTGKNSVRFLAIGGHQKVYAKQK